MAWRIGDVLDVDEQIRWTRAAGFDGVGFHASPGTPGQWQGVDFETADARRRAELRNLLDGFALVEVHAPFALTLADDCLREHVEQQCRVLDFAGHVGASIVTVHADVPVDAAHWREPLAALDAAAERNRITVGLELTAGFEWIDQWALPRIRVTLDLGHMHLNGGQPLDPYGSIGTAVRRLGDRLAHLHVHDYDGEHDHIELGAGHIDLEGTLAALRDMGYAGGMTLELNPDRVSPDGMQRSLAWLRTRV